MGINKFILQTKNPLKSGLLSLPIFYGITLFDNVFSIVHEGPKLLRMDKIATWLAFVVSAAVCIAVAILVQLIIVPWQRRKILGQNSNGKLVTFGDSDDSSAKSSPNRTDNAESGIGLNGKLLNDNNVNTNMSTNSSKALSSCNQFSCCHESILIEFQMTSSSDQSNVLEGILVSNYEDELCLNLKHDIKVFIKSNNSFIVKNYANYNCIAVSSKSATDERLLFSLQREGIQVHQTKTDYLNLNLVGMNSPPDRFTAQISYSRGKYRMEQKKSIFRPNQFKNCDQVFNHANKKMTTDEKDEVSELFASCKYFAMLNDVVEYHFQNDLQITQCPCGNTKITFFHGGSIWINPTGTLDFQFGNTIITSWNNHFYVTKGDTGLMAIDKIPQVFSHH